MSLPIAGPLRPATVLARPNRFSVQVRVEPESAVATAHLPDPAIHPRLLEAGARTWVRPAEESEGRSWTCAVVEAPSRSLVSVDPRLARRLAGEALRTDALPEFEGWRLAGRDLPLGRARFDFVLEELTGDRMVVEVFCPTTVDDRLALHPALPSERDLRQVETLTGLSRQRGWAAAAMFVVPRVDAEGVAPSVTTDPAFAVALARAADAGVRLLAWRCQVTLAEVGLGRAIPVYLPVDEG